VVSETDGDGETTGACVAEGMADGLVTFGLGPTNGVDCGNGVTCGDALGCEAAPVEAGGDAVDKGVFIGEGPGTLEGAGAVGGVGWEVDVDFCVAGGEVGCCARVT